MNRLYILLASGLLLAAMGCGDYLKSNTSSQLMYGAAMSVTPVVDNLVITGVTSSSITLAQPTFMATGNPLPAVNAYIGLNGTITVTGSTVTGSTEGPVDVYSAGYVFGGLANNTVYRIIVVAENVNGYSVKQIVQSTAGIAPVMNPLALSGFDASSVTLAQPTFATAGNPLPSVNAYVGLNGTISVAGSVVSNFTEGPIDVSSSGYQFSGLAANASHRVIVVAQNAAGYSVMQIVQSTAGIAPALNPLAISAVDSSHVTLALPTFATAGNPAPTVEAYIGLNGTISVAGSVVSNFTEGPVDVSALPYMFGGLASNTGYRIIVVAQNAEGYSVMQIVQSTAGIAPVLNPLAVAGFDSVSVTLAQPTFLTAGNPLPTVRAYIGLDGVISLAGTVVSNSIEGPVDVSSGAYQFNGLLPSTAYRIIVVSQNAAGFSTGQTVQITAP